jgi:hypothetical protein
MLPLSVPMVTSAPAQRPVAAIVPIMLVAGTRMPCPTAKNVHRDRTAGGMTPEPRALSNGPFSSTKNAYQAQPAKSLIG